MLRRSTAGAGGRTVCTPAVRSVTLVHPGRTARLCRRRRPARRYDDDPDEDRAVDSIADRSSGHVAQPWSRCVTDSDLTVIFRTQSDIEANVVEALLDSHGIQAMRTSGPTPGLFPFSVNPMGDTRIAVRDEDAADAVRIIDSHREQVGGGIVVPLPQEFDALEARISYRFKDRGLLEHALTHKSKAHEDPSGGVADNESLEFLGDAVLGLVVAELLFRSFPNYNEGQKSKIKATQVST